MFLLFKIDRYIIVLLNQSSISSLNTTLLPKSSLRIVLGSTKYVLTVKDGKGRLDLEKDLTILI